eukprot:m.506659 g.506659  ORF g.506659 m.506659 type:complete len:584 (-) comp83129_c0_seq1:31-1782(-)
MFVAASRDSDDRTAATDAADDDEGLLRPNSIKFSRLFAVPAMPSLQQADCVRLEVVTSRSHSRSPTPGVVHDPWRWDDDSGVGCNGDEDDTLAWWQDGSDDSSSQSSQTLYDLGPEFDFGCEFDVHSSEGEGQDEVEVMGEVSTGARHRSVQSSGSVSNCDIADDQDEAPLHLTAWDEHKTWGERWVAGRARRGNYPQKRWRCWRKGFVDCSPTSVRGIRRDDAWCRSMVRSKGMSAADVLQDSHLGDGFPVTGAADNYDPAGDADDATWEPSMADGTTLPGSHCSPTFVTCHGCGTAFAKPLHQVFTTSQLRKSVAKRRCSTCVDARLTAQKQGTGRRAAGIRSARYSRLKGRGSKPQPTPATTRYLDHPAGSFQHIRQVAFRTHTKFLDEQFAGYIINHVSPLDLKPAPIARFLGAFRRFGGRARVSLAFHGTNAGNIESICRHGLLVPGGLVKVVNGSVHGVGIYTAKSLTTSLSYIRSNAPMLACAIIDPGDSALVKHVGNIMVIFDESLVLPLFSVRYAQKPFHSTWQRTNPLQGLNKRARKRFLRHSRRNNRYNTPPQQDEPHEQKPRSVVHVLKEL